MITRLKIGLPWWSIVGPLSALGLAYADYGLNLSSMGWIYIPFAALLLGVAVFSAVHHAELIALRIGEPLGSLLLAIAVTVIESALILSIYVSDGSGAAYIARDTVYSTVMIVLNGVIGFSLVAGGRQHYEQSFRSDGIAAALAVLSTLTAVTLIFPNFTQSVRGPLFSNHQLLFVGIVSLLLYAVFIFVQTVRHRDYFSDVASGDLDMQTEAKPSLSLSFMAAALLLVSLACVVWLSKSLSPYLIAAMEYLSLPPSFLGIVIAAIVLLPESVASLKAALNNRLQNSLNLAIGSAIASIGLTIPVVAIFAATNDRKLPLGLPEQDEVLLALTLFISTLTLGTGRTTVLQGFVHLVIFGVFIFIAAVP
jgi:Ca2+:H+ antiporter